MRAVILGAVLWIAGYAFACWWWPFRACPRCDGSGTHRSPSGKAWRRCRRCRGSGARLRLGRRLINRILRLKREGRNAAT